MFAIVVRQPDPIEIQSDVRRPEASHQRAYELSSRVFVPNLRYRRDIGDSLVATELARVAALGLLAAESADAPGADADFEG